MSRALEDRQLAFKLWGGIATAWSESCGSNKDLLHDDVPTYDGPCQHQAIEHEVVESVMSISVDDDLGEEEMRCALRLAEFATVGGVIITALINMLATAQAIQTGVAPDPALIREWVLARLYKENMEDAVPGQIDVQVFAVDITDLPPEILDLLKNLGVMPDEEDPSD